MLNEVKFSRYAESGEYITHMDLAGFIKCNRINVCCHYIIFQFFLSVYLNHRPVNGLTPSLFASAFKNLGQIDFETKQWKIDRSHLLSILQDRGILAYKVHNSIIDNAMNNVYMWLVGLGPSHPSSWE